MTSKTELTILQVNDVHGYLDEHWELFFEGSETRFIRAGGYARMAGYIEQTRKETNNAVLLADGGDTFHGTHPVVETKGKITIPILNKLGMDAMTAHWDFAYGPDYLEHLMSELHYPMLAINCYEYNSNKLVFRPYIMKEINGLKIAVIGIAATIVDKVMPENFSEGIYFTAGRDELPRYIKEAKEQQDADLIVVMSHLGLPHDMKIAEETDGIDVYLSAHTHNRMYEPAVINGAIIIQSGCHGSFLGRLDLTIENKKVADYRHELVVMDDTIAEDEEVKQLVKESLAPFKPALSETAGETKTELHRYEILESTMDNFLLQSLLDYTGADAAFSNGWRYGAPIPKGPLTMNDLWNIIPVNPPVSTVQLTGREIWELMEKSFEAAFSREPFHQMGGYLKRALGIQVFAKLENPKGQRMQDLYIQNERVDWERYYDVAFVTVQGVPPSYGKNRKDLDIRAVEALRRYAEKYQTIEAPLRGTITLV